MKCFNRIISAILLLCMVVSMLPPVQFAEAAEVVRRYELDTDGIDPGATYLIVNTGSTGSGNAMRYSTSRLGNQPLTVQTDENGIRYIAEGFTNEADCQHQFSSATSGKIQHGNYNLSLSTTSRFTSSGTNLTFTNAGNGAYRIHYSSGFWSTYYLRYNNSSWARSTTSSAVYLYKLVEYEVGYDISFNGNGHTVGTLPQNASGLDAGTSYIIPAPSDDFRMDIGDDTYLFWCWTENADGTGTEYRPGDTITVDRDMTFYAQYYLQPKYTVTVVTDLNDVPTDVDKIAGEPVNLYIRLEGEDTPFLPLTRVEEGIYTAHVSENGTYAVYAQHGDGEPESEHGHKVIVYNQSGATELLNYSVIYDLNGGTVQQALPTVNYHANTRVVASQQLPTREGYRFLGWEDQDGNLIAPGNVITEALLKKTVLTAKWEELISITVNITINHEAEDGLLDADTDREALSFLLLQKVGNVDQPYSEIQHLDKSHVSYRTEGNVSYYTVTFEGLPKGDYTVGCEKSHYTTHTNSSSQTVDLVLTYTPDDFDLHFRVNVNLDGIPQNLHPKRINLRVVRWENGSWQDVDQQPGSTPITVMLDENGTGTGFLPVWKTDGDDTCFYRVRVSSFVMPDGTVVRGEAIEQYVRYQPEGSGLYTALVTVPGGQQPAGAQVDGAYFDGAAQIGTPTVNITVTPFTVTFDPADGTLNGQPSLILENQYTYPDLQKYLPIPNVTDHTFGGWYVNGEKAENLAGQYLTGDVTYVAEYAPPMPISGIVSASSTYEYKGQTVTVQEPDRIHKVQVVLQKNINGIYNDVDSRLVNITYNGTQGEGSYMFENLPDDGTVYRICVLQHNYQITYDNDIDGSYTPDESAVTDNLQVNIHLQLQPEVYTQNCIVDTSLLSEAFRPEAVQVQILYRDLGNNLDYGVISQHLVDPYGIQIPISQNGRGSDSESVWKWHNNITLYEYQLDVTKVYGHVAGVYSPEGEPFTGDMPFTVRYDLPAYYMTGAADQPALKATFVPKEYHVSFDLQLDVPNAEVLGMDEFLVDSHDGEHYAFVHTWGINSEISAYPYRPGYVFQGWSCADDGVWIEKGGIIRVGAELAKDVTLVANWKKLDNTDYTIRHLELNTDKVLLGATTVENALAGISVKAVDGAQNIDGYVYVGAMINGVYYEKTQQPELIVTDDPTKNVMVIYYQPDGSDGYTDQVEENLHLEKHAILEDNGTYTIQLETYTKDSPITTLIEQNTPLDIALVLDQSGSMYSTIESMNILDDLQDAVKNFITLVADHGRENEVDHRIAIVGYASDEDSGYTKPNYPTAGKDGSKWVNTGVFDSNGDFHIYPVTGFNYTPYTGEITTDGTYYTYASGEYLLLTFHESYRHLVTEAEARTELLKGTTVYGYVNGEFVSLTRNTSGLWLYGDKQLYSMPEFFTFHNNVWTHRKGTDRREIHGYMVNGQLQSADGHDGIFTRTETRDADPEKNIYQDALVPVSVGANGSGSVTPGLIKATQNIGANGRTYVSYGMEMANRVFEANPLDTDSDRVRIVVVFTDGKPGDSSNFDETESNKALALSYVATHTYGAKVYTIGLYGADVVDAESDQDYFMNGLSSNYPDATELDDVWVSTTFHQAVSGYRLDNGGPYFVEADGTFYPLTLQSKYSNRVYYNCWGYTDENGTRLNISETPVADGHPVITNGAVAGYTIYRRAGNGYQDTPNSGYYTVATNAQDLKTYFANVVQSITTKVSSEVVLHDDTIVRDIMGQGLVLTPGSVITAYKQAGTYDPATKQVTWSGVNEPLAQVVIPENPADTLYSTETTDVEYTLPNGTVINKENVPYINVYNLTSENATDPNGENYHPHTVDITGYDFDQWYLCDRKTEGYKMVVTITRIEARDNVLWGRATNTNHTQSGLWLPADVHGERDLLLAFNQPTTIFVERAYVLDYGKEFELSGWYFDSEDGKVANAIHVDCEIENGMNWFDPAAPNTANSKNGDYGNTRYGNVKLENGKVTYSPTSMNWGGYDQFYIFGNTWRKTVLAQDANRNGEGNLWNKVTVIPANNVYYEDSFITTDSSTQNGIEGFTFTGEWQVVTGENPDQNTEIPEHVESAPYGDVHGWTDALGDDTAFTDGSVHVTGVNGETGAQAEFSFTGTGVDVYTRTNLQSGMVVAVLNRIVTGEDGAESLQLVKSIAIDNLAASGDYYHIPTVSFEDLVYGSYRLQLIATVTNTATDTDRYEYYIDGIRVYNPLGSTTNYQPDIVKDAYGLETNAVFTEVRDILLDYGDFNADLPDSTDGKMGAVFIDWIQPGQEGEGDLPGQELPGVTGQPTYNIGTFETYGPKNEVYLTAGQAIVLKVDEANTYYVGLKSLTGTAVKANVSGIDQADPTVINLSHSTDMYYQVTPVDGYIVIQNGNADNAILSITMLRTTNLVAPAKNGGILDLAPQEAISVMRRFAKSIAELPTEDSAPDTPEEILPSVQEQTEAQMLMASKLFSSVRRWLNETEEVA